MSMIIPYGRLELETVERSGSGVELDYENPGSNPGCGAKTLGKFFSLYIAPVHSAVPGYRQWLICVRVAFAH